MSIYSAAESFVKITEEEFLNSGSQLQEKFGKATRMGFFYLEIPKECKPFIPQVIDFAHTFYKDTRLKELKLEGHSGYHDRENYQVESLYFERVYWERYLTNEVLQVASCMHQLSLEVLRKTLNFCGIAESEYKKITGGAAEGKGDAYFTCNHYRANKAQEGLNSHRDFGQITVLFINEMGLKAQINDAWVDVPPLENYFIINFGRALEESINNKDQLVAAWHRVDRVVKERISFGIFMDNGRESTMYQRTREGTFEERGSFKDYLDACFQENYKN